ncbi:MAG: DUF721 domain-containing protein [Rickettsiales bacterium]
MRKRLPKPYNDNRAMNNKNYKTIHNLPKKLAVCIEPLTRKTFRKHGLAGSKIIENWQVIVGKSLSKHCIPQRLSFPASGRSNGTLYIATENGFSTELQHAQPIIIERLATYFGYKAITRILITYSYTPEKNELIQKKTSYRKPQIDDTCINQINNIEDSELRNALNNMAKSLIHG